MTSSSRVRAHSTLCHGLSPNGNKYRRTQTGWGGCGDASPAGMDQGASRGLLPKKAIGWLEARGVHRGSRESRATPPLSLGIFSSRGSHASTQCQLRFLSVPCVERTALSYSSVGAPHTFQAVRLPSQRRRG